jgi:hypothetical protein
MDEWEPTQEELAKHQVVVAGDRPWQRRLRLLQALWREDQRLPMGTRSGREEVGSEPLGSRIAMPTAERDLPNYLTETIRTVVRAELTSETTRREEKLFKAPRIFNDLLSSQPLCFNFFGEMKADLRMATAWARHLWPVRVEIVTRLEFEHSPGRRDVKYLGNRTAFDVYIEHTAPGGGESFIGIEVKYHENLEVKPAEGRDRVIEVARRSGIFADDSLASLNEPPLQQLWFDHLLALSMLQADEARWHGRGLYVLLHPVANEACYRVAHEYQRHLLDRSTFERLSLEEAVAALQAKADAPWVEAFYRRYLDYRRA